MASGTINGRTGNSDVYAKIEWSYTQSVTDNKSSVTATVYIRRLDDGTWHSSGTTNISLTIAGTTKTESKYFWVGHYGTSDWFQMITNTVDVAHNADGTHADITISCTSSGSGTTVEPITCSGTVALPTIARASAPTATNATFGSTTTITTNRASSSFTHTITVSMGSHSQTISGVGASTTWTVPASWADTIPTATSNTLSISCVTYSGNTNIGTKTTSCTVTIPDSWKPTVTISKTLTNGGDSNQVLVNVTTVNLTASGSAPSGTSINSYTWSGGTVSGTGASKTHSPTSAGTFTYTVTVADKRGRTGTASVTATSESGVSSMSCASSVNFGSALAVTITRKKSSFTHNVTWQISSSYTNTATGQGTSASYTIPTSWAASVPAASSINMTVTVTTYNGSSSLGSVNKTVSVVVPSSWVPAFTLTTEAVSAFNSLYLKGVSKVKLTASSVSASTGSQIQSYSFSGNNVNKQATTTATSYNVTSDVLSVAGTNTYTVKVTDKRGRVTTKTTSITVTNYSAPTIRLSVGRYTSGGVADSFGGYGRIYASGTWSNVSGNKWTLTLKQKKRAASSYTTVNTYSNQTTTSISKTSDLFSADVDSVYDCQGVLTDSVGKSVTVTVAISTGSAIMDFFKDKVVGMFSTASEAIRTAITGSPATLFISNAIKNFFNGILAVGSNYQDQVLLYGNTEGGNIREYAPDRSYIEIDQYNSSAVRMYAADADNTYKQAITWDKQTTRELSTMLNNLGQIDSNTDMNNLYKPGYGNIGGSAPANAPTSTTTWSHFIVTNTTGNHEYSSTSQGFAMQIVFASKIYYRYFSGSPASWGSWRTFAQEGNLVLKAGDTMTGGLTLQKSGTIGVTVSNNDQSLYFHCDSNGVRGIYDVKNGTRMIYRNNTDSYAIRLGGNLYQDAKSRYFYVIDSSGNEYNLIGDNGSNLWIGATSSGTGVRNHTGGTFISTGWNSSTSAGNDTIVIFKPSAVTGGGTQYNALHTGYRGAINSSLTTADTTTSVAASGTTTLRSVSLSAGTWLFTARASFSSAQVGKRLALILLIGSSQYWVRGEGTYNGGVCITKIKTLSSSTTVSLQCNHDVGSATNVKWEYEHIRLY